MAEPVEVPVLAPLEAIAFFRGKGFTFGFSWLDVWQEEHARAFTVAKAMTRDVLETIRAAVDAAIAEGQTLDVFRKGLRPKLEAAGWWGKQRIVDPLTAQAKTVQLGSPRRLKTIFDANMRTAYQAGKWERFDRQKAAMPFLEYVDADDSHVRPQHAAWDGTILPIDDPWWDTHYGPCDWGCRCSARALSRRMLERRGKAVTTEPVAFPTREWRNKRTGEVHLIEEGIGPGWAYNVGKAALAAQAPPPMPGSFDGADIADARAAAAPIAAFFAAFDIEAVDARAGRVVVDRGGWPLAISLAWFQQDGRLMLPAAARRGWIGEAGRAIAAPDSIRWVWVRALDGSAMLMRRYVTARCVVDIGKQGWRFLSAGEADLAGLAEAGIVAWSAEQPAIAGYNPYQAREPRGSRHGGRFKSTGLGTFLQAVLGPTRVPMQRLGNASPAAIARIEALGIDVPSPAVWLEHSRARHAILRHGKDDRPVTTRDLRTVHLLLNRSTNVQPGARLSPEGHKTIRVQVGSGRRPTIAIFEVRRKGLVLGSMHKRGPRK